MYKTIGESAAFPRVADSGQAATYGLTKREFFAIQALQGLIAQHGPLLAQGGSYNLQELTEEAVSMADMLIDTLNAE